MLQFCFPTFYDFLVMQIADTFTFKNKRKTFNAQAMCRWYSSPGRLHLDQRFLHGLEEQFCDVTAYIPPSKGTIHRSSLKTLRKSV